MKKVKDALSRPTPGSRPWAIWLWNQAVTETELLEQLNGFVKNGFGGLAIRPSRDMKPAYLSEEFFNFFELVLATAKAAGIGIRLADDFALPFNDFFEGLAQYNADVRAQQLVLEHAEILQGRAAFEREIDDPEKTFVLLARVKNDRIVASSVKPLALSKDTRSVSWKGTGGDWQIMVFSKSFVTEPDGHCIPNSLNSQAAQVYAQEILEQFASRFSRYAPATFQGIVTEMPAYLPAENAIPWDDELIVKYRGKYKKDLVKALPSLFFEVDDSSAKDRVNVYSLIACQMYERFAGVLESWARKRRMTQWVLTPERNALRTTNCLRDCLAVASVPLSAVGAQNQDGTEEGYSVVRAVADANAIEFRRDTVSVLGRNRLCAGSTLQSLKTEIDLHALNGGSYLVLDGCFFNLDHRSHVRTPFNPGWYYPGWDQMRELANYASRLSLLMQGVHLTRPAAIIMPRSSLLADYLPSNNESMRRGIGLVEKTMAELQRLNIDYDIISEEMFLGCGVRTNGEFSSADRIRKGRYQTAIIPYARLVDKRVLVHLEKLACKKGTVIFIAEPPQGSLDEGTTPAVSQRIDKLVKKPNIHVVPPKEMAPLLRHIEPPVKVAVGGKRCPDIYAVHGSGPNYELYLLHNMAERRDFFASVQLPAAAHFYLADCQTGELVELKNVQKEGRKSTMGLTFAPRMTYVVIASSAKVATATPRKAKAHSIHKFGMQPRNYRVVLKDQWAFTPDSLNVLPLANWNTRIGLSRESGGYSHYSEAFFEAREIPDVCLLAMCGVAQHTSASEAAGITFEVAVNGNVVEPYRAEVIEEGAQQGGSLGNWNRYCGSQTAKYDIKNLLVKGFNRVSIRTVNLTGDPKTIVYPPLVAGTFSIARGARGWAIDKPFSIAGYDSWTKYGFPYLSGSGTYRQDFELPSGYKRIVLKFTQTSGPVSIRLNNKDLGVFNWHPMELDITTACEQRRNSIEVRVMNTMDNLLRMNGRASGLTGEAFLDVY